MFPHVKRHDVLCNIPWSFWKGFLDYLFYQQQFFNSWNLFRDDDDNKTQYFFLFQTIPIKK